MSSPTEYIRKPLVVEAMQVTDENAKDICDWMNSVSGGQAPGHYDLDGNIIISTREGTMTALIGDYVVREPNPIADRLFYPCKAYIWETGYVEKEDGPNQYRPLAEFRESGLLWLVNKVVFHHRGFGMGIDDETGTWSMYGDGTDSWDFWSTEDEQTALKAGADPEKLPTGPVDENEMKNRVESFFAKIYLAALRERAETVE